MKESRIHNTYTSTSRRGVLKLTRNRKGKLQYGFTLIEVLVFLFVFIIIITAIVSALTYVYRGQRYAFEQSDATRSARIGINESVRDLREASYADNGAYPIVAMATSSITFYSDSDKDNKIERIRYFISGTYLKRGVIESSGDPPTYNSSNETVSTVSDYVRNNAIGVPMFTYYDKAGTLMSNYSDVSNLAFVVIRIVVNLYPNRAPYDFELRSSAALRNIK